MNKTQWLEVKDLRKSFSTRSGPLEILSGISFSLDRGEAMAIMGPSGSGKSTLLYIVGTLEKPTKGQVLFEGQNPFDLSEPQLASFRNQSIGFVFQDHHLLPQYSVIENVLLPATVYTGDSADPESRAHHLLSRFGAFQPTGASTGRTLWW